MHFFAHRDVEHVHEIVRRDRFFVVVRQAWRKGPVRRELDEPHVPVEPARAERLSTGGEEGKFGARTRAGRASAARTT